MREVVSSAQEAYFGREISSNRCGALDLTPYYSVGSEEGLTILQDIPSMTVSFEGRGPRQRLSRTGGLIWTLVRTDFKTRYHGTILGFAWALLKPIAMFLVLQGIFSFAFAADRLSAQSDHRAVPVGVLLTGHDSRIELASRQGVSAR